MKLRMWVWVESSFPWLVLYPETLTLSGSAERIQVCVEGIIPRWGEWVDGIKDRLKLKKRKIEPTLDLGALGEQVLPPVSPQEGGEPGSGLKTSCLGLCAAATDLGRSQPSHGGCHPGYSENHWAWGGHGWRKNWERTWACLRHVLGGGGRVCPCFYLNRIVYVTTTTKMPQLGISIWMLNSACQFLQNSLLGLLFELHWIYRSNFGQLITILSVPTHKQGIYLYLFKSFEIFLSNSFQFLV